jgi:hypothetical protein
MRDLVDELAADLRPVRRRNVGVETLAIAALCAIELALWLMAGMARPDLIHVMETTPTFCWKMSSAGVLAVIGAATAIASLDPPASPRRGLAWIATGVALFLASACLGVAIVGLSDPIARLDWRDGVDCVARLVLLSIPPIAAFGLLMRRAAPTDLAGTAMACGVAAAAWAAFVFMFACPHDDPLYIAVWYTIGCAVCALVARAILPRLARW